MRKWKAQVELFCNEQTTRGATFIFRYVSLAIAWRRISPFWNTPCYTYVYYYTKGQRLQQQATAFNFFFDNHVQTHVHTRSEYTSDTHIHFVYSYSEKILQSASIRNLHIYHYFKLTCIVYKYFT